MTMPAFLRADGDAVLLSVKLQPRSSSNEIDKPAGNELRIRVTAPPVDSAANTALVRFLAEILDLPRNRVELMRGHTSRHKLVRLSGTTPDSVAAKLGIVS